MKLEYLLEYSARLQSPVALPILLFKKRYTTYCVPLVALDAVEKQVSQRGKNKTE